MTTITFDCEWPGGEPMAYGEVRIELLTGTDRPGHHSGGETLGVWKFHLDGNGEGSIDLEDNETMEPEGTIYEVTVEGSRSWLSVPATGGPYSWADPAIAVYTPPPTTVITGPPGPPGEIVQTVDLREFGTFNDGATDWVSASDVTSLLEDALAELTYGQTLVLPEGFILSEPITVDVPFHIKGQGRDLTRWGPVAGSTGTSFLTMENTSTWVQQGHTDGWLVEDLTLDGRGRTFDMAGMTWKRANRSTIRGVQFAHWQRAGLNLNDSVRECFFESLWLRHCGTGQTYPQLDISELGGADATNNLYFFGINSTYSHGDNIWICPAAAADSVGGARSVYFFGAQIHGITQAVGASITRDGYNYTSTAEMRNGVQFWVGGASSVFLNGSRIISAALGQPSIRMSGHPDDGSTPSGGCQLRASGVHMGGSSALVTDTFTANAGTDVITSSADHGLSRGARVQVTSDTTLPAGLTAGTDYFVVVDSLSTFHLAPTWRDAYEDTNPVDITDAGTGTHTWSIVRHDVHIAEELTGATFYIDQSKLDGTVDNGAIRVDDPSLVSVTLGQGLTNGSSQAPLQSGMAQPMEAGAAYLRADSSKTSDATLAAEPDLTLYRCRRNAIYEVSGYIFTEGATTGDFQFRFELPAGATMHYSTWGLPSGATTASTQTNHTVTTDENVRTIGTLPGGAGFTFVGTLTMGNTTGDVEFWWAQGTSDVTATVLKAGSRLRTDRIY